MTSTVPSARSRAYGSRSYPLMAIVLPVLAFMLILFFAVMMVLLFRRLRRPAAS